MSKEKTAKSVRTLDNEICFLKELYKSVVDSISDLLLVIDPVDFRIMGANEEASKQLKLQREEIIGRFCYEVSHHRSAPCEPPQDTCPIKELLEKGSSVSVEHTHLDKDNNKIYVEISVHPIRNRHGKIVLVTHLAKDITAKKLMQENILKSERLAAIGELSLTLANDLRNPLQAIQSAMYLLKNECIRLKCSSKIMEMIKLVSDSVLYADKIIASLLDFASDKRPILKKKNLNDIIKRVLSQIEKPANVEFIMELGPIPETNVDEEMLSRIFLNLGVNGIQAMDYGGTLRVSTVETKGFVKVIFRDTGCGISKEKLNKLFSPLFTTKSKGMGLSLANCKRLIEAHKGSIEVQSEEKKGTTFTIKLPVYAERGRLENDGLVLLVKNDDVCGTVEKGKKVRTR